MKEINKQLEEGLNALLRLIELELNNGRNN
jgi:hypothetical protein